MWSGKELRCSEVSDATLSGGPLVSRDWLTLCRDHEQTPAAMRDSRQHYLLALADSATM